MRAFALALAALGGLVGCSLRSDERVSVPAPQTLDPDSLNAIALQPSSQHEPLAAGWVEPLKPPPPACKASIAVEPSGKSSVSEVRSVRFQFDLIGVQGPAPLEVEFLAPGGIAYERRKVALSGTAFDHQSVQLELPVAGTVIDSSSLAGTWSASCEVRGTKLASAAFELSR